MNDIAGEKIAAAKGAGIMGPTEAISRFVVEHAAEAIPDAAIERAEKHLMDTVACMLAGTNTDVGRAAANFFLPRATGNFPLAGRSARTADTTAALVNGTFAHALDYDDVIPMMPGHPSGVIVSALLSAARPGATGRQFIDAYVIGLEAGVRIGAAVGIEHYKRGWHTTGTIAVFAAVAAIARLNRLTVDQTRAAFGLAASVSSGIQANFGTMTKSFHAGWAAQNAVIATGLAGSGFTVSLNSFEAQSGFFGTYGTDKSDVNRIMHNIAEPFVILSPGLGVKKYPCCYALHRSIEAMLKLREELQITPDNVASVVGRTAPGGTKPLPYTRPTTGLEGKFSLDYTLAVGLLDGKFNFAAYSDAGVKREAIQRLYPLVSKLEDPANLGDAPGEALKGPGTIGFHEVTVTMKDGRVGKARVDKPSGAPGAELHWRDLEGKFTDCAKFAGYSAEATARNRDHWRNLRAEPDMIAVINDLTVTGVPN